MSNFIGYQIIAVLWFLVASQYKDDGLPLMLIYQGIGIIWLIGSLITSILG